MNIVDHTYKQKEIVLEVDSQLSEERVYGTERELVQVMINILNNAKDAILDQKLAHAKVNITLLTTNREVIIEISDNAGGIPESVMPKIFDPYFTTKHESVGTGIGLSMSHKIITEHFDGILSARNEKEGACFIIKLPKK